MRVSRSVNETSLVSEVMRDHWSVNETDCWLLMRLCWSVNETTWGLCCYRNGTSLVWELIRWPEIRRPVQNELLEELCTQAALDMS